MLMLLAKSNGRLLRGCGNTYESNMTALFVIPVFFWVVPIFAWSWRSLFLIVLILGGFLSFLWLDHAVEVAKPNYNSGPFGFFGIAMFAISSACFAASTLLRIIGLFFQYRGMTRVRVLWIDFLSIPILFGLGFGPSLYNTYIGDRPAPTTCLSEPISIKIGTQEFSLPYSPIVSIYLGKSATSGRYLFTAKHQRDLCQRSQNGRRQVAVSAITIRFNNAGRYYHNNYRKDYSGNRWCKMGTSYWGKLFCSISDLKEAKAKFPNEITVFDPSLINKGQFGIKELTFVRYQNSRNGNAWKNDSKREENDGLVQHYADGFFVAKTVERIKSIPLTAYCYRPSEGQNYYCEVDEKITNSLRVQWEFNASQDGVSKKLIDLNIQVNRIINSIGFHDNK